MYILRSYSVRAQTQRVARFKNEEYTLYLKTSVTVFPNTDLPAGQEHVCILRVFGLARFENEEYTLYLKTSVTVFPNTDLSAGQEHVCILRVFGLARFENEEYTLYLAWAPRALWKRGIYFVFSVCLGLHALERRICIVLSVCLGLHSLRTKNIHCI